MISDQASAPSCSCSRLWRSLMRRLKNSSTVVSFLLLVSLLMLSPAYLFVIHLGLETRVLSFKERQLLWSVGPMLMLIEKEKKKKRWSICARIVFQSMRCQRTKRNSLEKRKQNVQPWFVSLNNVFTTQSVREVLKHHTLCSFQNAGYSAWVQTEHVTSVRVRHLLRFSSVWENL